MRRQPDFHAVLYKFNMNFTAGRFMQREESYKFNDDLSDVVVRLTLLR